MPIKYAPKVGQILMCDFKGMVAPEMVKRRPVIITNAPRKGRLAQIVCLSTRKPEPIYDHHIKIEDKFLPRDKFFQGKETWLKGDMIYTVSYDRLDYIRLGMDNGKRVYFTACLSRLNMKTVYTKMLHGMNLGRLCEHL